MKKEFEKVLKKGEQVAKDVMPKAKDALHDIRESALNIYEKGVESTHSFLENRAEKKDEVVELVTKKTEEVKAGVNKALKKPEPLAPKKSNKGKIVAGVAIASAAAAYAVYKTRKIKNDKLKEEYSEKMKRWAELNEEELLEEADAFVAPLRVMPGKIYKEGMNAELKEGVVINVSAPSEDFVFDPERKEEPLADLDIKKKVVEATQGIRDKVKTKLQEARVQTKLGEMEAKDRYVEIKDFAEDKFDEVKEKVEEKAAKVKEEHIKPNVEEVKDVVEDVKEIAEDLKKNDMADEPIKDFIDEPTGREEMFDKLEDELEDLQEDAEELLDEALEEGEAVKEAAVDKAEVLKEKALEAKEAVSGVVKSVTDAVKEKIAEVKEPLPVRLVEYVVHLHNGSEEDYFFHPAQIQLFDLKKRSVQIKPSHAEDSTLARNTLKPGESYSGKIFVEKVEGIPAGLLVFKDLDLKESILFLLEEGDIVDNPELILDEEYLYSDEEVLEDEDYKRL